MLKNLTPFKIEVLKSGLLGIVQDRAGHMLPPEAWTTGMNIRFRNDRAERINGHTVAFDPPTVAPSAVFNVPGPNNTSFWIYMSLTKAYGVESGAGADINITRAAGDYTAAFGRDWGMTILGGIPIWTDRADVPQYWSAISLATPLIALPNWDANKRAKRIVAFGSYLFAINLTESGVNKPHKVLVSHKADPGSVPSSWDPTNAAVDAVEFELVDEKSAQLLDAKPLGEILVVYKENSTHYIRFQGGNDLWKRDLLFLDTGILATRCVASYEDGTKHFVATQNDVIIHSGTPASRESVLEGSNRDAIFSSLDVANRENSFCFRHPSRPECWFCYPTVGNTNPNKAFIYNYVNKTPSFRDWNGLSADSGRFTDTSAATWDSDSGSWDSDGERWEEAPTTTILFGDPTASKLYRLDSGYAFGSSTPFVFLERIGLVYEGKSVAFGSRVLIDRVWPKITGTGKWSIQVGGQEFRDQAVTWAPSVLFDPASGQEFVDIDPPVNCRIPAIRFENQDNNASILEGFDLRLSPLGEH